MSASQNLLQQTIGKLKLDSNQTSDDADRISYGIISDIDEATSQVKVRFLKEDKTPGELVTDGFLPLINSLDSIHLIYGPLRPGLLVRIFWRGKIRPRTAMIEIIADENSSFLQKEPQPDEINIGPHYFLSGGI